MGDGSTISLWDEDWGEGILKLRFKALYSFSWSKEVSLNKVLQTANTSNLFRPITTQRAHSEFEAFHQIIDQSRLMMSQENIDDAMWKGHPTGLFTVKSAYYVLKNGPRIKSKLHRLWKLPAPPRFRIFGWLLLLNRILTTENLNKRGFNMVSICYLCRGSQETSMHLFRECVFSKLLYTRIFNLLFPQHSAQFTGDIDYEVTLLDNKKPKEFRGLLLIAIFIIWRERCARLFQEQFQTIEDLAEEVMIQWKFSNPEVT
jgi:hypothetical protein